MRVCVHTRIGRHTRTDIHAYIFMIGQNTEQIIFSSLASVRISVSINPYERACMYFSRYYNSESTETLSTVSYCSYYAIGSHLMDFDGGMYILEILHVPSRSMLTVISISSPM